MTEFDRCIVLMLALLNPFLVIIYLVDVVQTLDRREFARVLIRAAVLAGVVFCAFAILGDAMFSDLVQARFASFQIFGGIVFLLIGIQFVFKGPTAIETLRGKSEYLAGAIAMPVLIGPGTISASVIIGKRLDPSLACVAVLVAVITSIVIILLLKMTHDFVRPRREQLIQRYIEIAGRVTALYTGTVAVQMIMEGLRAWGSKF